MSDPSSTWQALLRAAVVITVATLPPLLAWDAAPATFWAGAHDALAAAPLAAVAVVCILQALVRRVPLFELVKTGALAAAFLFWAANQFWPDHPRATLFNDIAVALFVADVVVPWSRWFQTPPPAADTGLDAHAQPPISPG